MIFSFIHVHTTIFLKIYDFKIRNIILKISILSKNLYNLSDLNFRTIFQNLERWNTCISASRSANQCSNAYLNDFLWALDIWRKHKDKRNISYPRVYLALCRHVIWSLHYVQTGILVALSSFLCQKYHRYTRVHLLLSREYIPEKRIFVFKRHIYITNMYIISS